MAHLDGLTPEEKKNTLGKVEKALNNNFSPKFHPTIQESEEEDSLSSMGSSRKAESQFSPVSKNTE